MKRFLLPVIFSFFILSIFPQVPPGYYDSAQGLTGVALQAALHDIIKDHTVVDYGALYLYFETTDSKPGDVVWDMYSDIPGGTPPYVYHYNAGEECGNYDSEGDCFNREHSWPNSWFGGEVYPMYSDLFMLYPTDGYVNNRRSNYPYGEVSTASWTSLNGSKVGGCSWPGYSGTVFEPIDAYKGDFARTYFYISTRYYTEDAGWPGSDETTGSQLKAWALAMMLEWNQDDPVSQKETDRNNAVYLIQNNRNPFIDHPEYAELIWGNGAGTGKNREATLSLKPFPNPCLENCYLELPGMDAGAVYTVEVLSLAGRSVNVSCSRSGDLIKVSTSALVPGMYFSLLTVSGDPVLYRGYFIKE